MINNSKINLNNLKAGLESFDKLEKLNESYDGVEIFAKKSFDASEILDSQPSEADQESAYKIAPDEHWFLNYWEIY